MNLYLIDASSGASNEKRRVVLEELKRSDLDRELIHLTEDVCKDTENFINPVILILFDSKNNFRMITALIDLIKPKVIGRQKIVPLSLNSQKYIDTEDLKKIKASQLAEESGLANTVKRIKSFLGLSVIPKDNKIFISYRNKNFGLRHAKGVEDALDGFGYDVWRDERRDIDNEGKIPVGDDVQDRIMDELESSSLVLLIDTPCAVQSEWVQKEVNKAIGTLIPILPVVFKDDAYLGGVSNFRALQELSRTIHKKNSDTNYSDVVNYVEDFLSDLYKVKKDIPAKVSNIFTTSQYDWNELNDNRNLYLSNRVKRFFKSKIISQLPVYESFYSRAVNKILKHLEGTSERFNHRIFIYSGSMLSEGDILDINQGNPNIDKKTVILLHHEQIKDFLDENG